MSGASDSSGTPFDLIDVTNNDRKFVSEGLQISGNYSHGLLGIPQQFSFGVRAHRDTAKRRHKPRSYLMTNASSNSTVFYYRLKHLIVGIAKHCPFSLLTNFILIVSL